MMIMMFLKMMMMVMMMMMMMMIMMMMMATTTWLVLKNCVTLLIFMITGDSLPKLARTVYILYGWKIRNS